MKKQKLFALIAIVAVGVVTTFYACTKNNSESITPDRSSASSEGATPAITIVNSITCYTAVSQTEQAKMIVDRMSDGTYDVYVSRESIGEGIKVRGYFFPGYECSFNEETSQIVVSMEEGAHTFIEGIDPTNPIDASIPPTGGGGGGPTTAEAQYWTCNCCSGNGSCGTQMVETQFNGGSVVHAECTAGTCISPNDNTTTCSMTRNGSGGGITLRGGVLIKASSTNIRVHQI